MYALCIGLIDLELRTLALNMTSAAQREATTGECQRPHREAWLRRSGLALPVFSDVSSGMHLDDSAGGSCAVPLTDGVRSDGCSDAPRSNVECRVLAVHLPQT